jgi:hypothetical protein
MSFAQEPRLDPDRFPYQEDSGRTPRPEAKLTLECDRSRVEAVMPRNTTSPRDCCLDGPAPEPSEADPVDPDLEHRLARIPEWGNRVLRVTINGKTVPPRIVTAFFDRRRTIP